MASSARISCSDFPVRVANTDSRGLALPNGLACADMSMASVRPGAATSKVMHYTTGVIATSFPVSAALLTSCVEHQCWEGNRTGRCDVR